MHSMPEAGFGVIDTLTFYDAVQLCTTVDHCVVSHQWHALVVADEDGKITDKVVFELFSIDHVAGWAMGFRHADQLMAPTALLISAVTHGVGEPDALDLWEYECLRATLSSTGMELRDWLLTDGYDIRSLAYTACPESAWLSDPLPVRSTQLEQPDPGLA